MSAQKDFWKQCFDFEAVVAAVDLDKLPIRYTNRAGSHVKTIIGVRDLWGNLERYHDMYDREHFEGTSISPVNDVWDNRRKVGAK